jgi:hypothetical protein
MYPSSDGKQCTFVDSLILDNGTSHMYCTSLHEVCRAPSGTHPFQTTVRLQVPVTLHCTGISFQAADSAPACTRSFTTTAPLTYTYLAPDGGHGIFMHSFVLNTSPVHFTSTSLQTADTTLSCTHLLVTVMMMVQTTSSAPSCTHLFQTTVQLVCTSLQTADSVSSSTHSSQAAVSAPT